MEEEYFLDGKVNVGKRVGMFAPASGKLFKKGELGFVNNSSPRQRIYVDKIIRQGNVVFIVSYICKNCVNNRDRDEGSRLFLKENDAERYIAALGKAFCSKYNCEEVTLYNNQGKNTIPNILKNLSANFSVNFRTSDHEFCVTFLKIIY